MTFVDLQLDWYFITEMNGLIVEMRTLFPIALQDYDHVRRLKLCLQYYSAYLN